MDRIEDLLTQLWSDAFAPLHVLLEPHPSFSFALDFIPELGNLSDKEPPLVDRNLDCEAWRLVEPKQSVSTHGLDEQRHCVEGLFPFVLEPLKSFGEPVVTLALLGNRSSSFDFDLLVQVLYLVIQCLYLPPQFSIVAFC